MSLSHEPVGPKLLGKIKTYVLTRAELFFTLCYEIPCRGKRKFATNILFFYKEYLILHIANIKKILITLQNPILPLVNTY